MKKYVLIFIGFVILSFFLIRLLYFIMSSWLVTFIDSSTEKHYIHLVDNYYYNDFSNSILYKDLEHNAYRFIQDGEVDSIGWNSNCIVFKAKNEYNSVNLINGLILKDTIIDRRVKLIAVYEILK